MSPLYERKQERNEKLFTYIQRPSPKQNTLSADFAQSLHKNPNCNCKMESLITFLKNFLIEGILLLISQMENAAHRQKRVLRKKLSAAMTVEAAILLPLFLLFFLTLGSAMEMIRLHGNLELALWESGNRLAVYGHVLTDEKAEEGLSHTEEEEPGWDERLAGVALSYGYIRNQIIEYLGEGYLDRSPLTNGSGGLQFLESAVMQDDCLDIVLTYSVSGGNGLLPLRSFRLANRYYGHIWNGYGLTGESGTEAGLDTVYVTKYGVRYHEKRECTYIKLSVRSISWEEANERYELCGRCEKENREGDVYVTEWGDSYHHSKDCANIKRIVSSLLREEAERKGYTPCGRCSG